MKVPNNEKAVIDIRKLIDYCLNFNHQIGKHKARVFASALDLTAENALELKEALLRAVKSNDAQPGRFDAFGQRYTVDVELIRGAKTAIVRSAWIIETGTDFPKLTTCFIL